jgi:hypothetical protein
MASSRTGAARRSAFSVRASLLDLSRWMGVLVTPADRQTLVSWHFVGGNHRVLSAVSNLDFPFTHSGSTYTPISEF